jgi:hypothetical protein
MARTIGGNPLRNAARRMGLPLPEKRTPRPYTEEDRRRLLAPISISYVGGKSHAGSTSASHENAFAKRQQGDRYGFSADWADLDRIG